MPALSGKAPKRLLVMLHGAGSSAQVLVPAALAWQLKLSSAQAALLQAPFASAEDRRYWLDPSTYPVSAAAVGDAAGRARNRIEAAQAALGLSPLQTLVVGFSQGASVAIELAFGDTPCAAITFGYAARLFRLPSAADHVNGDIHLLHGGADSVVPAVYGEAAYRRLRAIGARVTLDVLPDEGHALNQRLINRGTQHAMDWLFGRGRQIPCGPAH